MARLNPLFPFALYLVLGIFYVLPSGLPQPADAVVVGGVIGLALLGGFRLMLGRDELIAVVALGVWTYLVNCWYFVAIGDPVFLKKSLFYLYNLTFFAVALSAFRQVRGQDMRMIVWASFIALLIETFVVVAMPELIGRRQIGTFNNPNQLAYWTLLNAAVFFLSMLVCRNQGTAVRGDRWLAVLVILLAGFVIGESLSKAGLAAYVVMVVLIAGPVFGLRWPMIMLLGILVAALGVIAIPNGDTALSFGQSLGLDFVDKIIRRLTHVQADDSLTSRGYFRLLEMPQYLIAGAGEGAFGRISASAGKSVEIHSTPVHFVTSYGLIGVAIFGGFAAAFVRPLSLTVVAVLAAILIYGLAHNGLRFTHFWLVLALIAAARPVPWLRGVPA